MGCAASTGAKDNNSFLASPLSFPYPHPSSLTHEGTIYSHFFPVPPTKTEILKCDLTTASSPDPFSSKTDNFLCVGTASKFDGGGLRNLGGRPEVGVVFVLDVSGSMGGRFYKREGKEIRGGGEVRKERDDGTLLDAAKEALIGLLNNFKEGDSFGLISFDTSARTEFPLSKWEGEKTKEKVIKIIKGIELRGGTDLTCGFDAAVKELDKKEFNEIKMNRRVFFLTDMRMTAGNSQLLLSHLNTAASPSSPRPKNAPTPPLSPPSHPIHTTVIGFGFDFDTDLTSALAAIPLCNYFSVFSSQEFIDQMTWEFDYLVFPIAQNLTVQVVGRVNEEGEEEEGTNKKKVVVEKVCGASERNLVGHPEGTVMAVTGIFASQTQGGGGGTEGRDKETKGGVVLVKLGGIEGGERVKVKIQFETYEGETVVKEEEVVFPKVEEGEEGKKGSYGGDGVRKGVLLSRYVEFMKRFLEDVSRRREEATVTKETGVVWRKEEGQWEEDGKGAVGKEEKVGCLKEYRVLMEEFLEYYEKEQQGLDDTGLGVWKERMKQLMPKEEEVGEEGGEGGEGGEEGEGGETGETGEEGK